MEFADFLETTLSESAKLARDYFGKVTPLTKPEDNNQVLTEADIAIGKYIISRINEVFPEHNIIDEEAGVSNKNSEYTWVVDPIEATSNFASGSEQYGIMIGLLKVNIPIAGGIILPASNTLYLAEKGKGATKNGIPIKVTKVERLDRTLVSVGIDGHKDEPEKTYQELAVVADIVLGARNIRNSGCEAVDPMYVAEGIYGGRVNTAAKIWDNVAPQVICEEAGALWTDTHGNKHDYSHAMQEPDKNYAFIVATPTLHAQLVEIVNHRL